VATDPAPNAEANLRTYIDEAWKDLTVIGLSPNASCDHLKFTTDLMQALADADLVQEKGPERQDFKMKLFADMDEATPPDSLIASSSSGITPSVMQSKCTHPASGIPLVFHTSFHWSKWLGELRHRPKLSNARWHFMRRPREETYLPAKETSRACSEPTPGRALSRDALPH
jgi:hypothetical protein